MIGHLSPLMKESCFVNIGNHTKNKPKQCVFTDEEVEAATAAVETNVKTAQIDIMEMLNPYSA